MSAPRSRRWSPSSWRSPLGQPVYGPLADAYGRRPPLIGGLVLFIAAGIGCVFAPDIETLIVLRFVQGLGICSAAVIVRAVIRDLYTGPRAAQLLALTFLLLGISPLIAPLAGSFFIAFLSWRAIFWVTAFIGLLGLALVVFLLPETLPPEKRDRRSLIRAFSGYGGLLFDGRFMALTMITGLVQTVLFAFVVGSAFFFMGVHGLEPWQYSLLFATCATVGIGLAQFSAPAMRKLGAERLVIVATTVCAAASTTLFLATLLDIAPLHVGLPLVWITFGGLAFVGAPGTVLALDPYGEKAGTASALMGTLQFGLSAIGAGRGQRAVRRHRHPAHRDHGGLRARRARHHLRDAEVPAGHRDNPDPERVYPKAALGLDWRAPP